MSPVWYRLRSEARSHWLSWLGVMLLTGLVVGLTLALIAGARRTETAFGRFLEVSHPSDLLLSESADFGVTSIDLGAAARLPGVEQSTVSEGWFSVIETPDGRLILPGNDAFLLTDPSHAPGGLDRARVLAGRAADPEAIDEAVVNVQLADRFGLRPGDRLSVSLVSATSAPEAQVAFLGSLVDRIASPEPELFDYEQVLDGPRIELRIVGVVAAAMEFPPRSGGLTPLVRVTPAFAEFVGDRAWSTSYLHVELSPSVTVPDYVRRVESEVAGDAPLLLLSVAVDQAAAVQRGFHLRAQGLMVLGGLFGLAGVIIIGQASARLARTRSEDARRLRELGWTTAGLAHLATARGLLVALGGAGLAVSLAILLSPLWPLGSARHAEVDPGLALDVPVMLVGTLVVLVLVPAAAVSVTITDRSWGRPASTVTPIPTVGPVEARVGASFALTSVAHGGRVPLRSSLFSVAAVASLLSFLLVFSHRLDALSSSPPAYGWSWDMQIGTPGQPAISGVLGEGLARNADVRAAAEATVVSAEIDGRRVDVLGTASLVGTIEPVLLAGSAPATSDEIALGRLTLRSIDAAVGDVVEATIGNRTASFTVVGEVVVPDLGTQGRLGTGGVLTMEGVARLAPDPVTSVVLVRFASDSQDVRTNVRRAVTPVLTREGVEGGELDFAELGTGAETALVALPSFVLFATAANGISTAVRRRRREFATLRALGWTRANVRRAVHIQGVTTGLLALAGGLAVGAVLGRVAWQAFATGIGVDPGAGTEVEPLLRAGTLVLALSWLATWVPARMAHARPPSLWLRSG